VFESLSAANDFGAVLSGGDEPVRVQGRRVTASLFTTLGAQPLLGRVFIASEDRPGGSLVVDKEGRRRLYEQLKLPTDPTVR
jgi:hypothetical protein